MKYTGNMTVKMWVDRCSKSSKSYEPHKDQPRAQKRFTDASWLTQYIRTCSLQVAPPCLTQRHWSGATPQSALIKGTRGEQNGRRTETFIVLTNASFKNDVKLSPCHRRERQKKRYTTGVMDVSGQDDGRLSCSNHIEHLEWRKTTAKMMLSLEWRRTFRQWPNGMSKRT